MEIILYIIGVLYLLPGLYISITGVRTINEEFPKWQIYIGAFLCVFIYPIAVYVYLKKYKNRKGWEEGYDYHKRPPYYHLAKG